MAGSRRIPASTCLGGPRSSSTSIGPPSRAPARRSTSFTKTTRSSSSTSRPACCPSPPIPKPDASEDTVLRRVREYVAVQARSQDLCRHAASPRSRYVRIAGRGAVERRACRRAASSSKTIVSSATTWRSCRAFPIRPRARSRRASRPDIEMDAASWSTMTRQGSMPPTDYRVRERLKARRCSNCGCTPAGSIRYGCILKSSGTR